jgi:hydrophobe/amphiphile efflux-1 (HAE1) family protein
VSISEPFIRRPIATSLLAAALLLAGAAAYTQLPVAPLPRVDFPTISVSAALPGASPETMASAVATPLERRFGRIAGIAEITSVSFLGNTSLTLQFDLDRDVDAAARDVQAAINAAAGDLPANLPTRPNFKKVNPSDAPILILALTSDTIPLAQVYDQANAILAQKISQVPGVGQVFVGGGQQPAVRVQVDPEALAGLGLGLDDVRNTLAAATADEAKGSLVGPFQAVSVAANDQLLNADAYRDVVVSYANGSALRLGDVATVFDDVENNRVAGWVNGKRGVVLIIRRQPGANIIDVIDRIKDLMPTLMTSISPAIQWSMAVDRSGTIRASVADVQFTLLLSVLLVVAVVFVFLRSAWATAIPSVAVPLSLVATFGAMYLLGYSLDNLSLMALTISTGFVVDDAIVVTENVSRLIEEGKSPFEAALLGAKQIGFTIVSITTSLLAVFIPILLMGGIVGRLFREFAVTLSVAIAISAVISLTLTPMMCSRLLRGNHQQKRGFFYRLSERAFSGLQAAYGRALTWVLRHSLVVGLALLATIVLTVVLFVIIPKGLFPQQDTGQIQGTSDAPQDISFPAMKKRQEAVNAVVMADPAVQSGVSFIGGGGNSALNTGTAFLQLKPAPPRKETADQVIARLRGKLSKVEGIQLFMQSVQDVRVGGRSARTQYQFTLQDPNLDELLVWAPKVMERIRKIPELRDVATDQQTSGLLLDINVDRDTASRLGIQLLDVDNALYDAFGQRQIATYYTQFNQYRVVMEVLPKYQRGPEALNDIYVRTATGQQVPISAISKATPAATSLSVNHQGQFPAVTLSFNLAPDASLSQAITAIQKAELEIGMPSSLRASFQGTAQAFQASLASEYLLVWAALIAVYIVLGVLYESLIHPFTILSTLPSAGVGAFLTLMVFKTDFSIIALIGMILLIGIVKKNAIMMIDFAIEGERERGLAPRQAIYEACLMRFRPILMTTLAALFGAVPLAVGHGAGSELRQPLGIAIVGGLLFSQVLTLFTTPIIYLALDVFSARRLFHREGSPKPVAAA